MTSTAAAPTSNNGWCIDLHHVSKTYRGRIRALDGITMQVAPGEVFGLLGPNGAGKSTLVKIMMTVIRPSRAEGRVLGEPVGHKPTLRRVGYLPEHHRFPGYLTGEQVLHFYGALSGVGRADRKRRAAALLERVGMSKWRDMKIASYSKGMMQRVGLAQALMNDPALVVLDEPTDGVDPEGRKEIRDLLAQLRAEGRTVFLNSHLLSEVEMVCNRVAILLQGKVVVQGTIDELTRDSRRFEIEYAGPEVGWISEINGASSRVSADGSRRIIALPGREAREAQPVIDRLRADQFVIHRCQLCVESLEDLFIRSVRDPKTGRSHLPGAVRGEDES
ncbi:MAG: ABC transporter ATP-binding protein [Phycisphaerales bacterium]|nr:ABC transporter ATP-binding protein [Phycisphaerales bacterium]